jgi:hypothetical protein
MTIKKFWQIVNKVHRASKGNMSSKRRLLHKALRKLPAKEVRSFDEHFGQCEARSYTWKLWAAAYIIGGGCSDDMFSDFRAALISMGPKVFELVTKSPAALVDVPINKKNAFNEGYESVASDVYEEITGDEMPVRARPHPKKPTGKDWREDNVANLFPDLARKHKFKEQCPCPNSVLLACRLH